jgi:hypothetical protein
VSKETTLEASLRHEMERSHVQEIMQEREEQRQKQREMARWPLSQISLFIFIFYTTAYVV